MNTVILGGTVWKYLTTKEKICKVIFVVVILIVIYLAFLLIKNYLKPSSIIKRKLGFK